MSSPPLSDAVSAPLTFWPSLSAVPPASATARADEPASRAVSVYGPASSPAKLVAATVIGAGVFVVSLPFTALGGGVGDAGQALVVDPARAAFVRCLGCIGEGFEQRE